MSRIESDATATLLKAEESNIWKFKKDLQDSFRVSAEAEFGHKFEEPIPSDEEIEQSISAPGSIVYWVVIEGEKVGGAVVLIDEETQDNTLALFFISTKYQNRGFGYRAWRAIEEAHPKTKVWETVTPYFEKRNIHFYVNRCGFRIVEFYNRYNPDPNEHSHHISIEDEGNEMFRFEKILISA